MTLCGGIPTGEVFVLMSLLPTAYAGQSYGSRRIDFFTVSGQVSASDANTGRVTDPDGLEHYVKLIEQIGFCNYRLGNKDIGRKRFQEVLEWYRKLPIEDKAVPTELIQCLPESDEIVIEMKKIEDYLN